MRAIVPFKLSNPKSRLSTVLSLEERRGLAKAMLLDVLEVVNEFFDETIVLVPPNTDLDVDCRVEEDERDLNSAINDRLERNTAVVMSDLPLLSYGVMRRFLETEGDIVIAPGRKGGTNMLLVRVNGFRVSYHYGSFLKHVRIAEEMGLRVGIFDSFYASVDVDEEEDLLELMLHGRGKRSWSYLRSLGFDVDLSEEQPKLVRVSRPLS